jgi:ubiquinone/menaquinone biosynthesis C-methylase UbiE
VVADGTCLPFRNVSFNSIMIPEVLEHMPFEKSEKMIRECKRCGKIILVTLPNAGKTHYDKLLVENPEHLWLPTESKVKEILGDNVKISYTTKKDFILVKMLQ